MKMTAEIEFLFVARFSALCTVVRNIELSSDTAMETKLKTQALHLPRSYLLSGMFSSFELFIF